MADTTNQAASSRQSSNTPDVLPLYQLWKYPRVRLSVGVFWATIGSGLIATITDLSPPEVVALFFGFFTTFYITALFIPPLIFTTPQTVEWFERLFEFSRNPAILGIIVYWPIWLLSIHIPEAAVSGAGLLFGSILTQFREYILAKLIAFTLAVWILGSQLWQLYQGAVTVHPLVIAFVAGLLLAPLAVVLRSRQTNS